MEALAIINAIAGLRNVHLITGSRRSLLQPEVTGPVWDNIADQRLPLFGRLLFQGMRLDAIQADEVQTVLDLIAES